MSTDRLGQARVALLAHAVIMTMMVVFNAEGIFRLLFEQFLFGAGLYVTNGEGGPETLLLVVHVAALGALATALALWRRQHAATRVAMRAAAASQLLLLPVGLAVAWILWWLSRHDDLLDPGPTVIGGDRRWRLAGIWSLGLLVAAFPAGLALALLELDLGLWAICISAACLPPLAATWWLLRERDDPEPIMPPLPETLAR